MFTFCKIEQRSPFWVYLYFRWHHFSMFSVLLPLYIRPFLYSRSILPLMPNYISVSPKNIYDLSANISNLSKQLPYFINTIFCNYNENAFGSALVRFDTTLHFIFENKKSYKKGLRFYGKFQ